MQKERLIPYRSNSQDLTEFMKNTASEIEQLYKIYNSISSDTDMLITASRLQEMAIAGKMAELMNMLNAPEKKGDGTWEQRISIDRFTATGSGIVMPRFNLGSVIAQKTLSCITVETTDGREILPSSVKVRVEPAADGKVIKETPPEGALCGYRPWWRVVPHGSNIEAKAVYTVELPVNILEKPEFNQIRVVSFPLYGVTINAIEYRYKSKWTPIYADLPADGAIFIATKPTSADAIRVELQQKNPVWLNNKPEFHFGIAVLAVERAIVSTEPAVFTAEIELQGVGPWKILSAEADAKNGGKVTVSISDGVQTLPSSALPAILHSNRIKVVLKMEATDELQRPVVSSVILRYKDSSESQI